MSYAEGANQKISARFARNTRQTERQTTTINA